MILIKPSSFETMASRLLTMASAVAFGAESAISVERGRSLVPIAASAAPRAAKAASSGSWEMNRTTSEPRLWLDCVRGKTTVMFSIRKNGGLKRRVLGGLLAMSFRRRASISTLPIQGFDLKGILMRLECLTRKDKIEERSL